MQRIIIIYTLLALFMGMAYGQVIPPAPANCAEQAQKLIDYARALGNFESAELAAANATQKSHYAMHVRSFNKNRWKFFKDCSPNLSLMAELNNKICVSAKPELQKMT
jgi:hypothetical protein